MIGEVGRGRAFLPDCSYWLSRGQPRLQRDARGHRCKRTTRPAVSPRKGGHCRAETSLPRLSRGCPRSGWRVQGYLPMW